MKAAPAGITAAAVALLMAGCSSSGISAGASASPTQASAVGKQWKGDSSGWWVPTDPTGCLNETVSCVMVAWSKRRYGGETPQNAFKHGETITLLCKASTPAPIRNSVKTYSRYWFYSDINGKKWWVPDIYAAKDDAQIDEMAAGVPDCTADTPGIDG